MRKIGSLPNEEQARTFEDYLLTLGVRGQVDSSGETWAVWIQDEDDVERGKQELADFVHAPQDSRFAKAAANASKIRNQQAKERKQASKRVVDVRQQWQRPMASRCPATFGLIIISVIVAFGTELGDKRDGLMSQLSIASFDANGRWEGLSDIQSGQVWRLVTPIFIHFGFLHILFNMMWLRDLGSMIESRRGTLSFLLLLLVIAVLSNFAQFWMNGPHFGGMSGVVFGLFGYIWMKSRFEPESGFYMHPNIVFLMIAWFLLCTTGAAGAIANYAHGVGLAAGMAFGYGPSLWRR